MDIVTSPLEHPVRQRQLLSDRLYFPAFTFKAVAAPGTADASIRRLLVNRFNRDRLRVFLPYLVI